MRERPGMSGADLCGRRRLRRRRDVAVTGGYNAMFLALKLKPARAARILDEPEARKHPRWISVPQPAAEEWV